MGAPDYHNSARRRWSVARPACYPENPHQKRASVGRGRGRVGRSPGRPAPSLEWRWRDGERDVRVAKRLERTPLRYDVFPGRSYDFILALAPPPSPRAYTLELGLVDEGIAPFAHLGTPPVRVPINVR